MSTCIVYSDSFGTSPSLMFLRLLATKCAERQNILHPIKSTTSDILPLSSKVVEEISQQHSQWLIILCQLSLSSHLLDARFIVPETDVVTIEEDFSLCSTIGVLQIR